MIKKQVARYSILLLAGLLFAVGLYSQTATIKNVWTEHNVSQNGMNGMKIHVHFSVSGMKGNKVRVVAFFYNENKRPLTTSYSNYQTADGDVCTRESTGNILYENTVWKDFILFIPYETMNFAAGKHTYYFRVYIRPNNSSSVLTSSQYYSFSGTGSNTRTVRNADGSISERTENADGSITTVTTSICSGCNGTGKCRICGGQGGLWGGFGQYRRYVICTGCKGATYCTFCIGSGKKVLSHVFYPSSNTAVTTDLQTGQKYFYGVDSGNDNMGGGNDNSNSRNRVNTGKTTCTYCNGTGKDPSPKYGPDYTGGAVTTYKYCSICGKTSERHYHDVCPGCRGLGYY